MNETATQNLDHLGVIVLVVLWRAWPMIGILSGSNLHASTDFGDWKHVAPPSSAPVAVYDGLPHPFWKTKELWIEILAKPRRIIHGHAFYRADTDNDSAKKIAQALSDHSSFEPWIGESGCGGFHADKYFRWTDGSQEWEILLCMGCDEALLFSGKHSLRCVISREAAKKIDAIEEENQ